MFSQVNTAALTNIMSLIKMFYFPEEIINYFSYSHLSSSRIGKWQSDLLQISGVWQILCEH